MLAVSRAVSTIGSDGVNYIVAEATVIQAVSFRLQVNFLGRESPHVDVITVLWPHGCPPISLLRNAYLWLLKVVVAVAILCAHTLSYRHEYTE